VTNRPPPIHGLPEDVALLLAEGAPVPLDLLSESERARADAFSNPERRHSFALGRAAARLLLAERVGCGPAEVPLVVRPGGAPALGEGAWHVSIAHAGRGAGALAGAAVGGRPVGLDVERAVPRHPGLLARLLTPEEAGLPDALDGVDEPAALVWAMKEAVLKGLGTGFRRSARSIRLTPRADALFHADDGGAGWSVRYAREGAFWLAVAWQDA
jgi:4'-phosphopantetheinyl transferase